MSSDSESSVGDDPSYEGDTGVGYGSVNSGTGQFSLNENDGSPTQLRVDPMIAINAAKKERAEALSKKQKELTDAFGTFGDDYYDDLATSFTDFQTPLLSSAYADATRGMYDGFKAKGLLSQAEVDAGLGDLLTQKTVDSANISTGASGYAQAKRDEVTKKQQSLGDALSAMAGGATTLDDINKQTENIKAFDFSKDVDKLKPAGAKTALTFFDGFTKIPLAQQPTENVAPVSSAGAAQSGSITPAYTYTGINDPYRGSTTRVVS
jgi:hypothetical protein